MVDRAGFTRVNSFCDSCLVRGGYSQAKTIDPRRAGQSHWSAVVVHCRNGVIDLVFVVRECASNGFFHYLAEGLFALRCRLFGRQGARLRSRVVDDPTSGGCKGSLRSPSAPRRVGWRVQV